MLTKHLWESWGLPTRIEEMPVMLTYPLKREVRVVSPPEAAYTLLLKEAVCLSFSKCYVFCLCVLLCY